jgi:hypothetical protein
MNIQEALSMVIEYLEKNQEEHKVVGVFPVGEHDNTIAGLCRIKANLEIGTGEHND